MEDLCTEMIMEICFYLKGESLRNLSACIKRLHQLLKNKIWAAPRFHTNFPDILHDLNKHPIKILHGDDFFYTSVFYLQQITTLEYYVVDDAILTYQDLTHLQALKCNIIFHTTSIQPHHSVERISTILQNLSCELVLDHFC